MADEDTKVAKSSSQKQESTEDKPTDTQKPTSSPTKGTTTDQSKSPQKNNNKTDNNTPSNQSKPSTPSSSAKSFKGAASIDKYNELKKRLTQQILKKQEITNKLSKLEDTIYQKESDYFEESYSGNIVKGFENFSKSSGGGAGGTGGGSGSSGFKRRIVYTEDDHIFSLSSISFVKNMVKRHGAGYATNGSLGNGAASSIINSKDDFDDYEDSVDPTTANLGVKSNNPVAAAASTENNKSETSRSSTPSRKRKARTIED